MATAVQQFPDSQFPTIYCTRLVVNPDTTNLKWNPARKHPGITILGKIDIARSLNSSTERGVIASEGYVIGTDSSAWYYIMNESVVMHVGMAEYTQSMTTTVGVAFDNLITVSKSDRVRFILTGAASLTIRHESQSGDLKSMEVFDMFERTGKKLYPWISTVEHDTMAVKILRSTAEFIIDVQDDGKVVMHASNNSIVDLNIGDIAENSGVSGVVAATDKIQNTTSGAVVECKNDGGIVHNGGVRHARKSASATINILLGLNDYSLVVSNVATTSVTLPPASTVNDCMKYTISRTYPKQLGEMWQNPMLKLYGNASDTIDGEYWIGLPPDTSISVMSVSNSKWKII